LTYSATQFLPIGERDRVSKYDPAATEVGRLELPRAELAAPRRAFALDDRSPRTERQPTSL
jgi:hypothetical protein